MFQNTTEIIKNFFSFFFFGPILYIYSFIIQIARAFLSLSAKPAFCELSFSDPVSVCMAAQQS